MTKSKATAIELKDKMILAAVLGGTNLGCQNPLKETVKKMAGCCTTLDQMIHYLWSGCMESEEHQRAFVQECRWWLKDKTNLNNKKVTVEYVRKVWPDVAALVF